MRTLVIGLDGACFELIEPWIEEGELPNLGRIKKDGVWAHMDSCLPPTTCPSWKCYSTGKNPGKLGLFWWQNVNCQLRKVYYARTRINRQKEIWDYLGERGAKVGVLNMPVTYPPKEVNGFMVSGESPDAREEAFTYPKELESYLKTEFDYRIQLPQIGLIEQRPREVAEAIIRLIKKRFEVAKVLMEKENPDFFHVTIFYINTLQHYFWNDEDVKKGWKVIDEAVGQLLKGTHNTIIMSDHGSNEIELVFNINTWLEKEHYLVSRRRSHGFLYRIGVTQQRLGKLFYLFGVKTILRRIIPARLVGMFPTDEGTARGEHIADGIDWDKTKVVASGQGPVYLNMDKLGKDYTFVKGELVRKLEALENPATARPVVDKVYTKEELYSGAYLSEAPDLVIDQAARISIAGEIGRREVFERPRRWRAENKRAGLFMAYGPDVKSGGSLGRVSILDLAPTILHMMRIPVPRDMDGRVLTEVFKVDSEIAKRNVIYEESTSAKDRIRKTINKSRRLKR